MEFKDKFVNSEKTNKKIQNKKRGEILYYSINQVADLLNESIDNIKYYTNIFDDLLKISIVDKELHFTNNDVDNLEFLIKLKNRGMTLKEIQDYCSELPLSDAEAETTESNLLSVEELINLIKEEQKIQLKDFKDQLISDIQNLNSLHLQNISSSIIEAQNKTLNEFKENLFNEIIEQLNSKFSNANEVNLDLNEKFVAATTDFVSEIVDSKSEDLKLSLHNDFNTFTQSSLDVNERLIKEVKDFKGVIQDAYYIQQEMEIESTNAGFLSKFMNLVKPK
ncbi:helix-turn-helix domain-containing protein [Clostridium cellulovorans]|uniref:HTH merR-type domain-containing protein n=1 Tax=Clostridium cellulovorans (strain ATCC 35296 / DSM 3052 / OCM 3 / 743B) TaxID=573061 RepID=D9SNG0_CLOC7|nr:helix-turn-helix domain-containing protein [Clostridium cellulovorans]ADL53952.1 hypothetical protein Clocel_4295 [Clostridium cellulovorans 743B]